MICIDIKQILTDFMWKVMIRKASRMTQRFRSDVNDMATNRDQ